VKVAVTGAGGFIGRYLVRALLTQTSPQEISCLVRSPDQRADLESLGVRVVMGSLAEPGALADLCRDADVVFHLAARVRYGIHSSRDADFYADNVQGTIHLIEACPASVRRFIHMSSVNAVERAPADPCRTPLTEESLCRPQTPYGRSKLLSEEAVRRMAPGKNISFLILRPPSIVYGAGCNKKSGMAILIQAVSAGSLLTRINFPGRFSVLHVQDLIRETIRMGFLETLRNETFFLADEPPCSIPEISEEIARSLGLRRKPLVLPNGFYSAANRWLSPLMPFQILMLLRDQAAVSSEQARLLAGFSTRVSLSEGLKETIPWVLGRS